MEELIKDFECHQTLMADDLHDIVSHSNSIVQYIKEHESEWSRSGTGNNVQITPIGNEGKRIAKYKIDNNPEGYIYAPTTTPGQNGENTIIIPRLGTGTPIADYVASNGSGTIYAPSGNAGPDTPSKTGYQKTYFTNISKNSNTPNAPLASNYNKVYDKFTAGSLEWVRTNVNPTDDQDTYAIWVYFDGNDNIITIDGPIKLTGGGGGSNGEDGEEIEWIYFRTQTELTIEGMNSIQNYLMTCKGTVSAHKWNTSTSTWESCTFQDADAVPIGGGQDWTDNAKGIDVTWKYEYAAIRRSENNDNGKRTWGNYYFHGPMLWSAYGKQGMDGDGIEYIFYADHDSSPSWGGIDNPTSWGENTIGRNGKTFQQNEFIADQSKWMDDPIDLENTEGYGPGSVEYVSIRKKINNVWQSFSPPVFWTRYAKDGVVDGYTVDLVNENMPVGTDDSGTAENYSNRGWVQAYYNGSPLTYASTASEGHFTYTIDTNNISRSDGTSISNKSNLATKDSNDPSRVNINIPSISNFDQVNLYIPIIVTLPNNTTRRLEFTLYGVAAGASGVNIELYYNASAIYVDANHTQGSLYPKKLQIGVQIGKNNDSVTYISGASTNSAESLGYYFGYCYDNSGNPNPITGDISLSASHDGIYVEMRKGEDFEHGRFIDSENIPYVLGGPEGRGIVSSIPYYKAVAREQDKPNDIGLTDATKIENTGWGASLPYLYHRYYTTYTNGQSTWGEIELDRVWIQGEGESGEDGYCLIVTPPYAIFEEPIDQEHPITLDDGTIVYHAGTIDYTKWSARVQLLKGNTPLSIGYTGIENSSNCSANIVNGQTLEDQNERFEGLLVTVASVEAQVTEALISFWITLNNSSLFKVNIPIYVNRIGSRLQTIAGDVETTIMSKTIYAEDNNPIVVEGNTTIKYGNIGTYIRSSQENVQRLEQKVNGIPDNTSEIIQTASEISMSVNNGWYNYITNPLAIDGRLGIFDRQSEIIFDQTFGKVIKLGNTTGGDWQLSFNLDDNYEELTGNTVSWFCVVKNLNISDGGTLNFGSGYDNGNQYAAIMMTSNLGNITVETGLQNPSGQYYYDISTEKHGAIELQDKWYLCWTSVKLNSGRSIMPGGSTQVGFNSMSGTWQIYYAGIVKGAGHPTLDMIMTGAGLKKAGIDITHGTVDIIANNTTFSYYDKNGIKQTAQVSISAQDGTLHAVNGDFSGTITSTNGQIGSFDIGTNNLNNNNYSAGITIQNAASSPTQVVKIGSDATDDLSSNPCSMRAESTRIDTDYNTALYLNAQKANYNYAFHGIGNGVLNGYMQGYKVKVHNITPDGKQLELKDGKVQVIDSVIRGSDLPIVYLPKLGEIKKTLGIKLSDNSDFCCELVLINQSVISFLGGAFETVVIQGDERGYSETTTDNNAKPSVFRYYNVHTEQPNFKVNLQPFEVITFYITYVGHRFLANYLID